jgi:hypothetical protein
VEGLTDLHEIYRHRPLGLADEACNGPNTGLRHAGTLERLNVRQTPAIAKDVMVEPI